MLPVAWRLRNQQVVIISQYPRLPQRGQVEDFPHLSQMRRHPRCVPVDLLQQILKLGHQAIEVHSSRPHALHTSPCLYTKVIPTLTRMQFASHDPPRMMYPVDMSGVMLVTGSLEQLHSYILFSLYSLSWPHPLSSPSLPSPRWKFIRSLSYKCYIFFFKFVVVSLYVNVCVLVSVCVFIGV